MSNIDYMGKNRKASPAGTYYYSVIEGDLWEEIFKKLPIKSLCRFRSVCKLWNSLISSAFFINLHLAFTSSSIPRNLKPYLHVSSRRCGYLNPSRFADLVHKCYALYHPLDDVGHSEQNLYFPFWANRMDGIKRFTFVDVIHGVVCISYSWIISHQMPPNPAFILTLLWNPTIHKYVSLPSLRLHDSYIAIGFGYDTSRNDFKVVLISILSGTYQVYSDRQGLWKTSTIEYNGIKLEPCWQFPAHDRPIFVNGTIHWILSSPTPNTPRIWRYSVLMFDCESEEFRRIDIPEKLHLGFSTGVELFEYAGMLAALVSIGMGRDLWVMEEHGVSTSWKKLYVLAKNNGIIRCDTSFENMSPYGPSSPWNKYRFDVAGMCHKYADRVYDETMFLMDHPKSQSYTNKEIVPILTEDLI